MASLVRGPTMDETRDSICLSFDLEVLKFADLGHWQNTEQSVWSKFIVGDICLLSYVNWFEKCERGGDKRRGQAKR